MLRVLGQIVLLTVIAMSAGADNGNPVMTDGLKATATRTVLVFGGTGRLGSEVVKAILVDGHNVTVFARESSSRERLKGKAVQFVIGDVLDAASVDRALEGNTFDVVIDALGRGTSSPDFFQKSATNIADSAAANGVEQIILHGSVGAGNSAAAFGGVNVGASMRRVFDAKSSGEAAVVNSGVRYTIIRNARLLRHGTPDNGNAELYEDPLMTGVVTRAALARLTASCVGVVSCYDKIYHAVDRSR